jgi:hypothetical protein
MVFVLSITLWSLVGQAIGFFGQLTDPATGAFRVPSFANGVLALVLVSLALFLVVEAVRSTRRRVEVSA